MRFEPAASHDSFLFIVLYTQQERECLCDRNICIVAASASLTRDLVQVRTPVMNYDDIRNSSGSARAKKFDVKLHFGAKKFLGELRDTESVWSLMVDGASRGISTNAAKICPVFVFSFKSLSDACLVDGRSVTSTHSDGTVMITGSSSTPSLTTTHHHVTSARTISILLRVVYHVSTMCVQVSSCLTSLKSLPSPATPITCRIRSASALHHPIL